MKRVIVAWAAIAVFLMTLLGATQLSPHTRFTEDKAGSVVKVTVKGGHGSAVHIGNGYFLSAAHVIGGEGEVKIKGDDGRIVMAEVLWTNKARDIAFLRADGRGFHSSTLSCLTQEVGTPVYAVGNPLNQDNITMWGRIAGVAREVGPWKAAYVTDMTILPGMSGGGMFNSDGELIGISVGVALRPMGMAASLTGMGYVTPSTVVCDLLAKQ